MFAALDSANALALGFFLASLFGYQYVTQRPWFYERSIASAVQKHRVAWMRTVAVRENRNSDALLLGVLSNGNAFFASTSAIAIGGLAAIVGSGEKTRALVAQVPIVAEASPALLEFKVVVLMLVFVYAFFKFAWAFRLTHYCAILIGAMPLPGMAPAATVDRHAIKTAELNGIAADHSNSGLRSFYFAGAVMTWLINPIVFMLATTGVLVILIRRDFFSRSRRILGDAE